MRLLICTQTVDLDDPVLGFFHRWIEEFARHAETVHVICLREGRHALPANVKVYSLGKESGRSRVKYIWNFYRYIWCLRREYDAVFVHMNPEYVVLGGVLWRFWGKRIGLWYVHKSVDWRLRLAVPCATYVFTATKESLGLVSRKMRIVGHGIDTVAFSCSHARHSHIARVVSIGRISRIKNCELLIEAAHRVYERGIQSFEVVFIGDTIYEDDRHYRRELETRIHAFGLSNMIRFEGWKSYAAMPEVLCEALVSVNLAPTGGTDKAILESLSCGTLALACNAALKPVFGEYASRLLFRENDTEDLADKLVFVLEGAYRNIAPQLMESVRMRYALPNLISAIIEAYAAPSGR